MQSTMVILFCIVTGVICCCRGVQGLTEYRKSKDTLDVVFGWIFIFSSAALLYYGYTVGLSNGY